MFSDGAGTVPVLTTDTVNGFAFTVDVNRDGTTTVTNSSAQTGISSATNVVPEPSSLGLVGEVIAFLGALRLRQHGRENS
jgi:hypothetical protein